MDYYNTKSKTVKLSADDRANSGSGVNQGNEEGRWVQDFFLLTQELELPLRPTRSEVA